MTCWKVSLRSPRTWPDASCRHAVTRPDRTYEIHEVAELTGLAPHDSGRGSGGTRSCVPGACRTATGSTRPTRSPCSRICPPDRGGRARRRSRRVRAGGRAGPGGGPPARRFAASRAAGGGARVRPRAARGPGGAAARSPRAPGVRRRRRVALAQSLGDLWALGRVPIAAEHLASEVVLHALKGGLRMSRGTGPLVVCGCLSGERHEWGFLATLAVVQEDGWRIHYLGADLPVDAVVEAAWKLSPEGVAFSGSDPSIVRASLPALAAVVGKLPPRTMAVIGGGRGRAPRPRAPRLRIENRARSVHTGRRPSSAVSEARS